MADTTRIRTNAPRASVTRLEPRLSIAGDVPKHANFQVRIRRDLPMRQKIQPDQHGAGADYPRGRFGQSLRQIAQLIKSDVGVEMAFADIGGGDHHVNELGPRPSEGVLANLLREYGQALKRLLEGHGRPHERCGGLAEMLLKHLDGIANYCETKVRFGVVEAVNGNIRMLINRGRGYKNLRYLLLKAKRMAVMNVEFITFRRIEKVA
jgi:hypothetical protein